MPLEFRVTWQREGRRRPKTVIYQSFESAMKKMRSVSALDAIKADFPRLDGMPDLAGPPELQVREVGAWRKHDYQPQADEFFEKRLHDHMSWTEATYSDRERDPSEVEF